MIIVKAFDQLCAVTVLLVLLPNLILTQQLQNVYNGKGNFVTLYLMGSERWVRPLTYLWSIFCEDDAFLHLVWCLTSKVYGVGLSLHSCVSCGKYSASREYQNV